MAQPSTRYQSPAECNFPAARTSSQIPPPSPMMEGSFAPRPQSSPSHLPQHQQPSIYILPTILCCIKLAYYKRFWVTKPEFRKKYLGPKNWAKCAQNGPNLGFPLFYRLWIIRFCWTRPAHQLVLWNHLRLSVCPWHNFSYFPPFFLDSLHQVSLL